jgi:hypothetical protein
LAGVATRVIARTFEYDSAPRRMAALTSGNPPRAWATRTFSRAAPRPRPMRQLSQCAQEWALASLQPAHASNRWIRTRSS